MSHSVLKSLSISNLFHSVLNSIVLFTVIYIIYFVSITETHHIATPSHIRHYHSVTYAMQYYFPHRAHYHTVLYKQCTYHILCCINNAHITVSHNTHQLLEISQHCYCILLHTDLLVILAHMCHALSLWDSVTIHNITTPCTCHTASLLYNKTWYCQYTFKTTYSHT